MENLIAESRSSDARDAGKLNPSPEYAVLVVYPLTMPTSVKWLGLTTGCRFLILIRQPKWFH
jgi:hypothetical protein